MPLGVAGAFTLSAAVGEDADDGDELAGPARRSRAISMICRMHSSSESSFEPV
ncbi:MAG TPA: hypothetical protein VMN39_00020 [Longimicrobiaceae bacterium]|nr:hypothetical protein [Longimicrobiaceae bacterium]